MDSRLARLAFQNDWQCLKLLHVEEAEEGEDRKKELMAVL